MYYKLLAFCVVLCALTVAAERKEKLFFVSTFSSTTLTTTTTTINTVFTCLKLSKTAYGSACAGRKRKKRTVIESAGDSEGTEISISNVQSHSADPDHDFIQNTKEEDASDSRQARFAWYYMTTTVASVTTRTETTYAYTSTVSVSAIVCTPKSFNGCGRKKKNLE